MFLAIVINIWTALHLYVFWRAASVPIVAKHVRAWALVTAAAVLWASFILGRILDHHGAPALARPIDLVGANWLGVIFLIFTTMLTVDIITGFGRWLKPVAPALRGWALAAGGLLSLIALVQGMRAPVVVEYEVPMAGLPADADGLVLVAVSDTHLGSMLGAEWLQARTAQIEALKPDLIVVLGDMIEGDGGLSRADEFAPVFRRLHAPLGVWAVMGNHEHYAGEEPSLRFFQAAGFRVLRDEWKEARPGLVIVGIDDSDERRGGPTPEARIAKAMAGRPRGAATILLSHRPKPAPFAVAAGAGLVLSGHTHGGQIWPFGYLVAWTHGFMGGRYEVDRMPLIVCRGSGTWGPRMRLWRRGELLRITLRPAAAGHRNTFSSQKH